MGSTAGLGYKVTAAVVIFVFTLVFTYIPFWVRSFKTNKSLVSLANCLAGGIFFSAGLIHILPDAQEAWEKADSSAGRNHSDESFPWITFSVLCSFTLILFVDRVLLPGHHSHAHSHSHDDQERGHLNEADSHPKEGNELESHLKAADHEHEHGHAPLGPYMLVVAMGFHAFFEGLALGLLENITGFSGFLLAILFHKWAEGAAVGISFLTNRVSRSATLIGLCIFSSLTPLGVATGILFSKTDDRIKAVLLALSAGTFFYIAICEILSEEFANSKISFKKFCAYTCGAALMVGVWFVEQLGQPDDD